MSEIRKFLFDNFIIGGKEKKQLPEDDDIPEIPQEDQPFQENIIENADDYSVEVPSALPEETFSRLELEAQVAQAEKNGYDRGYKTAQDEQLAENNRLLTDISQKLVLLLAQTENEDKIKEEDAVKILKKGLITLVPVLQDENANILVSKFLEDNFNNFKYNEKLSFYIHPDIISYIQEAIVKLAKMNDFEGKIAIHKDSNLEKSSCRVEWDNGGVEYKPQEQLLQVSEMLDKQ